MKNINTPELKAQTVELQSLLPKLSPSDQNFANNLLTAMAKWNGLTVNQAPWIGKLVEKAKTPKPEPTKVDVGGFEGVVALFNKAKEKLKYPKITLMVGDSTVVLSLAGAKAKEPGSITVTSEGRYLDRTWYGRVSPYGQWTPSQKLDPSFQASLQGLLVEFGKNPARVAQKYGALTGNCCFCAKGLSDPRSTAIGYGPVCAVNYGLHDKWKAAAEKHDKKAMESFTTPVSAEEKKETAQAWEDFGNKVLEPLAATAAFPVGDFIFKDNFILEKLPNFEKLVLLDEKGGFKLDESFINESLLTKCEMCKEGPATEKVENVYMCSVCKSFLEE